MTSTPVLALRLLGSLQIDLDGQPVDGLKTTKTQALLVYLAQTGRAHSRHELAGIFWSEDPEQKAKNSLRVALSNLNKLFPEHIQSDRLTVALRSDSPIEIDSLDFDRRAQSFDGATEVDVSTLQQVTACYAGDFLLDFHVDGAPEFETWLLAEREHYRQLALDLLEQLSDQLLEERHYPEAVDALKRLLAVEPWYERAHRRLMLAYSRTGDLNRALAQYEICQSVLQAELEVEPMPETQALHERIRAARQERPSNLPSNTVQFVGRDGELAKIGSLLLRPDCRLITVAGLGGTGKTRLAIEAARQVNREQAVEFLNGVLFVPLADVESAEGLPSALIEVLGTAVSGRGNPLDELLGFLQHKELLLVLDNLEHLLDGVELLSEILARAPGVKLLVTSREPLGLAQEWRFDLVGLTFPQRLDDPNFEQYDAVQLFLSVAQHVQPTFAIDDENRAEIRALCRAVDGMPLALCLAAPWLRATSIAQIVREVNAGLDILETNLSDIPQRQRSLRVICEQSWNRLKASEQKLLCRLAVFRGGCTYEAAQAIAAAALPQLAFLVDRAFLRHTETGRYEMHELIRQFVTAKLDASGTEAADLVTAHAHYFAQFADRQYQRYLAGEYPAVVPAINADIDNLRVAWTSLVEQLRRGEALARDLETLVRSARPLTWYQRTRARYAEGIEALQSAIDAVTELLQSPRVAAVSPTQLIVSRERLRIRLAMLFYYTGRYEETQLLVESALPILRADAPPEEEAYALEVLSRCVRRHGEYDRAKQIAARIGYLYRQVGDTLGEMQAVVAVAVTAADEGDYALAEEAGQQVVDYYREMNDIANLVLTQSNLANTLIRQHKYAEARPLLEEAYALADDEGNLFTLMMTGTNLARVAQGLGDDERAEVYAREALTRAREIGDQRWTAANLNFLSSVYRRNGSLKLAEQYALDALAITHAIPSEMDMLSDLSSLAHTWAYQGEVERALKVLIFVQWHPSTVQHNKDQNHQLLHELRAELPAALISELEAWCRNASLDDLIETLSQ